MDYKKQKGHDQLDVIRNLTSKRTLTNKDLEAQETLILDQYRAESKEGYEKAFKKALPDLKEIRLGVYFLLKDDQNRLLMTRTRSKNRFIWNFPGGGVIAGESIQTALRRELKEELSVDCWDFSKVHCLFTNFDFHINPDFLESQMINSYFELPVNQKEISLFVAGDVEAIKWFDIDNLPLEAMLSAEIEFINFLKNTYEFMKK